MVKLFQENSMKNKILSSLLACLWLALGAQAQTAHQIMSSVKHRFDDIKDYTVTVTASVNMERMNIPEMKATMYFKQPDKMHVESKNFSMLPKEGMSLNPSEMLLKFDATLLKSEIRNGTLSHDLRLVSKAEKGKQVREYFVTVNGDACVVSHIESFPMPGRKITIDFTHAFFAEQYWLPTTMNLVYSSEQTDDAAPDSHSGKGRNIPRKGTASIRYTDYKINTGLPDTLFEKIPDAQK